MHPTPMPRWRSSQEDFAIGDVTWEIIDASGAPEETLAQARMEIARMEIARRQ